MYSAVLVMRLFFLIFKILFRYFILSHANIFSNVFTIKSHKTETLNDKFYSLATNTLL